MTKGGGRLQNVIQLSAIALLYVIGQAAMAQTSPWLDTSMDPARRAALLLAEMTLDEKIAMVHGVSGAPYVGSITNNDRLGIPGLHLQDGPAGIAQGMQGVTALPAPILLGATWDVNLARQYGVLLGTEARGKGVHVLLGPMINMVRVPQGGRDFEFFGEDPFLSSAIAAEYIRGVQAQGVIANAKTFICNDQETTRGNMNAHVDERTLQEIYFPPFRASVRAGVGSVMSAYNGIDGPWSSESPLVGAVLKAMWGFDGFVMCDWGANFATERAANNGLDLEMPYDGKFGDSLSNAVQSGVVAETQLDDMVRRILTAMFRFNIFDAPATGDAGSNVTGVAHAQFCRDVAAQGMVLLKNNGGLLPLNTNGLHSIAVIGTPAFDNPIWVGLGSAQVYLPYYDIPLDAISNRAGTNVLISYCSGQGDSITQAVQIAQQSDIAIVCVGEQTGEGTDRTNLSLPDNQDALVGAVAAANSNTVVVMYEGAGTLMPWLGQVPTVLMAWYPGQENGKPLASVLFGDVNPSGKLPVTFPAATNQVPANTVEQFPGTNLQVHYSEGLLMGYRWYDASNVPPLFPFGHGLSYTTFGYSNLTVGPVSSSGQVSVGLDVKNTGNRPGAEVVQLYVGFPAAAGEPPQQLKGFRKLNLAPGQTNHLVFNLDWEDLACWNTNLHAWYVPTGLFQVRVGSSSRDIRLTGTFTVSTPIPSSGVANRALFKPVQVSAVVDTNNPGAAAVDGDPLTAWRSSSNAPQWITVDLGAKMQIVRARLQWDTNFAAFYRIRFSQDNTNWTPAYITSSGTGGTEDIVFSGAGRYVQLYVTQVPTTAGVALKELELFSPEVQISPTLTLNSGPTNTVLLSWPSSWGGSFLQQNTFLNWSNYVVEQTADLKTPNWITAGGTPGVVNGTNQLILLRSTNQFFYRLRSP